MEEKERYEYFFGTNTIKDNKTNQFYGCVVDLLNQQDKRIKELEQSQKRLAIEILKELRDKFFKIGHDKNYDIAFYRLIDVIEENLRNLYNGV